MKLSMRAQESVRELSASIPEALRTGKDVAVERTEAGRYRWWTFAGGAANTVLSIRLQAAGESPKTTDFWIEVDDPESIATACKGGAVAGECDELFGRLATGLKFHETLEREQLHLALAARYLDFDGAEASLQKQIGSSGT